MRKFLFLDIDGVLATQFDKILDDGDCDFDMTAVLYLNTLCEKVPILEIVISSSWRYGNTVESMREIFKARGFKYPERIVGFTPRWLMYESSAIDHVGRSAPRGIEIAEWLSKYGYPEHESMPYKEEQMWKKAHGYKYLILDDDGDMLYCQRGNFVQTDTDFGFTSEILKKSLKILNS